MKLSIIYKLFALALLAFIFQSRSGGPASIQGLQVTGAPGSSGSQGTCANAGCHGSGSFSPSMTIELLDANGSATIDKYIPGENYLLSISITAGNGSPSGYGLQAVALNGSNQDVSNWTSTPSGLQSVTLSGRNYIEHASPLGSGTVEIPWTAPVAGTAAVTFYSAGIAMNGNGNTSGDGTASNTLTVEEDVENSTFNPERDFASIDIYPNPVANTMNMEITSRTAGNFALNFVDISGKVLRTEQVNLVSGQNELSFEVAELQRGMYLLQLSSEEHITSKQLLKL